MHYRLLVVPLLGLALVACDKTDPLGCAANRDCPTGHICLDERCAQVCDDQSQCPRGYVCTSDGVCARGSASAPRIDEVTGNGSTACPSSPAGRCFADGLVITGDGLDGATFGLESTTGGQSFPLALGSGPTATAVTVLLPETLIEGEFLLVAQNSAGEDQVGVRILQGEPGPALTGQEMLQRINSEGTSSFVIARMPAPDDMILHINNGTIKLDPDLLPPSGTTYDGNDIVGLINDGGTTLSINAGRLATPDTLMQRINSSATLLDTDNLPVANDLIGRINQGNGTVKLSSTVLPASGSGGPSSGDEVVALLNDGGTTDISLSRLPTGTSAGTLATGDHTHSGYAPTSHTHDAAAISSGTLGFARLPTGTGASQVAVGNHTHDGTAITSGTVPFARLPTGTSASQVAVGNHTHAGLTPPLYYQRTTANSDLNIPVGTIAAYCGDTDGCTLKMGIRYAGYYDTAIPAWIDMPAVMWGPPCPLHIDASGNWATGFSCQQNYSVQGGGSFQPYVSDVYGVVGDTVVIYPMIVGFTAGGSVVCQLSERGYSTDTGDADANVHFWMGNAVANYFDHGSRTCELVIED